MTRRGPGRNRMERRRERNQDQFAAFCDRIGQPDPCCGCQACTRYFAPRAK